MLPRAFIEHQRRLRAAGAAAKIAHEFGIAAVTVRGICELGRMARNSFYEVFAGVEDCLRFGFAEGFGLIFGGLGAVSAAPAPWPQRLDAGLESFYGAVAAQPLWAELCLVHCFGAAEAAAGNDFEAGVAAMVGLLEGGREIAGVTARASPAPLTEECLAQMFISLAAQQVPQGAAAQLPGQRAEMVVLALGSFLGPQEAGRVWAELEAERIPAAELSAGSIGNGDT